MQWTPDERKDLKLTKKLSAITLLHTHVTPHGNPQPPTSPSDTQRPSESCISLRLLQALPAPSASCLALALGP